MRFICHIGFLCVAASLQADPMKEPWTIKIKPGKTLNTHPELQTVQFFLHGFQRWISPVDGPRCGFYPTCSTFSQKAIARHGFVVGTILTASRLLRDNGSENGYQLLYKNGQWRIYDPLENHWPPFKKQSWQ